MIESKRRVVVIAVVFAAGLVIGAVWHWARLFPVSAIGAFKLRVVTLLKDEDASHLTAGRWRKNPDFVEIDEEHKRAIQRLRSVGYVSGSQRAPDASGVTMHDESRAWEGLNLVVSGHAPEAYMMDMAGEVVHRWTCDVYKAWPDFDVEEHFGSPGTNMHTFWHRAHLMPNGDLLAIFDGIGIVKLDKQSNVLWQNRNGAHHDLYVAENGDIYLLTRRTAINPKHNPVEPILEEFITVLDPGGSELRDFSVFDALRNSPFRSILGRLAAKGDIFHTNTIELVESTPGHHESPFKAGSVLISVRQLSLVCAVDMDTEIVYWAESDRWQLQHQPTLLENGNMLIFDNFRTSDTSAVVEFDPTLSREEWSYVGDIDGKFFSPACGSCQRLPNGNTLITESDPGRAFEVTPAKEMVWEYVNPQRAGDEGELIATLFEIIRLPRDVMSDWL